MYKYTYMLLEKSRHTDRRRPTTQSCTHTTDDQTYVMYSRPYIHTYTLTSRQTDRDPIGLFKFQTFNKMYETDYL